MTVAELPALGDNAMTSRVVRSTTALLVRSAWERALSLLATLVLARLLLPRDLGLAALVLSATALTTIVVDAGMTSRLTQQPTVPSEGQFRAARRAQRALAVAALAVSFGVWQVAPVFGLLYLIDNLQLLVDPLVLQPRVMLQRALDFRGLALADGLAVLTRSVLSLAVAVVSQGPAALVLGDLAAAVVYALVVVGRLQTTAPAPAPGGEATALGMARQGLPFQLFMIVVALRELSSSALVGGLVGLRGLGLFQFASRSVSPVQVVFSSLQQLAIPMGVVVVRDKLAHHRLRQGYLLSGLVSAVVLSVLAAPAQWLVPAVFGARWAESAPLIFAMAFALCINGPAVTFGIGLLLAGNHTRFATAAAAALALVFLVTLVGLHSMGGLAPLSIAWVSSAMVETTVVVLAVRRLVGVRLGLLSFLPGPVFLLACGAGLLAAHGLHGALAPAVASAATALTVSCALVAPLAWGTVRELFRASRGASTTGQAGAMS